MNVSFSPFVCYRINNHEASSIASKPHAKNLPVRKWQWEYSKAFERSAS